MTSNNKMTYMVTMYRDGAFVHEVERNNRDAAELVALDAFRAGCEVTIYHNGRALRGWYRRAA